VRNWLSSVIKPVHKHPAKQWYEFSVWHEPFAPLQDFEHGIVRRLSAETVHANGLILDYADRGAATWRVS
jgi:hypothetical protein